MSFHWASIQTLSKGVVIRDAPVANPPLIFSTCRKKIAIKSCFPLVLLLMLSSIGALTSAQESADESRNTREWKPDWKARKPKDDSTFDLRWLVEHNKLAGGTHEYIYRIASHPLNKGTVETFTIDISCDQPFAGAGIPLADDPKIKSSSKDDRHPTIAEVSLEPPVNSASLTKKNQLVLKINLRPGEKSYIRLLSSGLSVYRNYRLDLDQATVQLRQNMYADKTKTDKPWITDPLKKGTVIGPGCIASKLPWARATDDFSNIYQGVKSGDETSSDNSMLSYPYISDNSITVKFCDTLFEKSEGKFVVQYNEHISPESFNVVLNGENVTSLFNPAPEDFSQPKLPLKPGKNHLELSVLSRKNSEGQQLLDKDSFNIELEEYYYVDKWLKDEFPVDPYFYSGELTPGENLHVNEMLSYRDFKRKNVRRVVLVDPSRPAEYGFVIYYSMFIDPKSLMVTLNNTDVTSLFNPRQANSETVNLPFRLGKNTLELKVTSKSRSEQTLRTDYDSFVIELIDAKVADEMIMTPPPGFQNPPESSDQILIINGRKFEL